MTQPETITPSLQRKPQRIVAGIATRTNNQRENDSSTARIPALWDRFYREGIAQEIPNDGAIVGVVYDYESDHTGDYTSMAGVVVQDESAVPANYETVTLAADDYLVFRAEGPVPESVLSGWQAVWAYFSDEAPYVRRYTADYEVYEDDAVEIHIAVQPR